MKELDLYDCRRRLLQQWSCGPGRRPMTTRPPTRPRDLCLLLGLQLTKRGFSPTGVLEEYQHTQLHRYNWSTERRPRVDKPATGGELVGYNGFSVSQEFDFSSSLGSSACLLQALLPRSQLLAFWLPLSCSGKFGTRRRGVCTFSALCKVAATKDSQADTLGDRIHK